MANEGLGWIPDPKKYNDPGGDCYAGGTTRVLCIYIYINCGILDLSQLVTLPGCSRKFGSMISKWTISPSYNGVYWGYP